MSMHFAKALCLDKGICTEACVNNVYSMFVMKQYFFWWEICPGLSNGASVRSWQLPRRLSLWMNPSQWPVILTLLSQWIFLQGCPLQLRDC